MTEPRWRFSSHALDRLRDHSVSREAVLDCLADPTTTYPGEPGPAPSLVARCDDITVVFNPETYEIITVHKKENAVSGWVNLTAKEAEKLLQDWGFEVQRTKPLVKLWYHPLDPQRLIPFVDAATSQRENGKSSYRAAAQVVGVSMNAFLQGPTDEWKRKTYRDVHEALLATADGPDPLGIRDKVAHQKAVELSVDVIRTFDVSKADEVLEQALAEVAEEATAESIEDSRRRLVLEAIEGEPLFVAEVAHLLDISPRAARESLTSLIERKLAVRRLSEKSESDLPGRPGYLYLAGPPGTEVPKRHLPQPATAPEPDPIPEETPVSASAAEAVLESAAPSAEPPQYGLPEGRLPEFAKASAPRVFEEVGLPWPTGGVLVKDENGNLYVARKLTEEGR